MSGPALSGPMASTECEPLAVHEQRGRRDGDDAGGQAVEAVDVVDRGRHPDHPQHGEQRGHVGPERHQPGERDAEEEDADAGDRQDAARRAPCRRPWRAATPRGGRRPGRPRRSRRARARRRAARVLAIEDLVEAVGAATPTNIPLGSRARMAAPPSSAVGSVCTRRSSGACTAPTRNESRRNSGVVQQRDERGGGDDGEVVPEVVLHLRPLQVPADTARTWSRARAPRPARRASSAASSRPTSVRWMSSAIGRPSRPRPCPGW